jgi:hypothetical protein
MGHAIPRQQPAVVLRSHFYQLRALLAVALVAVVGLTVAVVILATDSNEVSRTSAAKPVESIRGPLPAQLPNPRYDGGPEEGSRGVVPAGQPNVAPGARYDGGPEEGSADVTPPQAEAGARPDGDPEEGSHLR